VFQNLVLHEPARVCYDGTGLKQALRFPINISWAARGEHICVALNRLHKSVPVYTVSIAVETPTTNAPSAASLERYAPHELMT